MESMDAPLASGPIDLVERLDRGDRPPHYPPRSECRSAPTRESHNRPGRFGYPLVSATPLSLPDLLTFAGVYQPATGKRGMDYSDQLTNVLGSIGGTRDVRLADPTTWSIDHMLIPSVAK